LYSAAIAAIDGLTNQVAKDIRQTLLARWSSIKERLESSQTKSRWGHVQCADGSPQEEEHEGLMAVFPEMDVAFPGVQCRARAYVTVCRPPRHSKVWLRVAYVGSGVGAPHSDTFSAEGLKQLFDDVTDHVREEGVKLFVDVYRDIVEKALGKTLHQVHSINIYTVAADLGIVAEKLASKTFGLSECFADSEQYARLQPLLCLAYGMPSPTLADHRQMSSRFTWMSVRSRGENESEMVGLYAASHERSQNTLTGVVHVKEHDLLSMSTAARDLSRKLLSDIAPQI